MRRNRAPARRFVTGGRAGPSAHVAYGAAGRFAARVAVRKERRAIDGRHAASNCASNRASSSARSAPPSLAPLERPARHGRQAPVPRACAPARAGNPASLRPARSSSSADVGVGVVDRARGYRLDAERGGRRQTVRRQQRRGEPGGKLRQAEAVEPEGRPARAGKRRARSRPPRRVSRRRRRFQMLVECRERTGARRPAGAPPRRKERSAIATLPSGRRAGHPGQASARWPGTDDSIKPGVTTGVAAGARPEGRRLDKARRQDEFASLVSAPTQVKRHGPHVPAASP